MTLILQTAIWKVTNKMGIFACHEVGIGSGRKIEIVDFLTYNTKGEWRCFEIKVSKQDFYSKHKKTFVGNFNYYVMPPELYEQVKQDIPKDIGVYTYYPKANKQCPWLHCCKKAKRKELIVNKDILIYSIIKSLSREYDKIIKGTKLLSTWYDYQLEDELKNRGYKINNKDIFEL
jgi:hypothetical protein